ncbi:MAG: hypothetical protein ACP5RP_02875 [Candidatus Micrarchaeia archaeon]
MPDKKSKDIYSKAEEKSYLKLWIIGIAIIALILLGIITMLYLGSGSGIQRCERIYLNKQRYQCLENLANYSNNTNACLYLPPNLEYGCIRNLALKSSNPNLCGVINNTTYNNMCLENVSISKKNLSLCTTLKEPFRASCFFGIEQASNFSSFKNCFIIGNESMKEDCIVMSLYLNAVKTANYSECKMLGNSTSSYFTNYIENTAPNLNYTSTLMYLEFQNATPKEYCYYMLSLYYKNESSCNNTGKFYQNCKLQLSVKNTTMHYSINTSICNNSNISAEMKNICIDGIITSEAVRQENASICTYIKNVNMSYSCMEDLASTYRNTKYCDLISNATMKSACIRSANGSNYT